MEIVSKKVFFYMKTRKLESLWSWLIIKYITNFIYIISLRNLISKSGFWMGVEGVLGCCYGV